MRADKRRSRSQTVPTLEEANATLGSLVVRAGAVAGLALLVALSVGELSELRGELASARFHRLRRLAKMADESGRRAELERAVQNASAEAALVTLFSRGSPEALRLIAVACLSWSRNGALDPILRLRLGERAVTAAALATRAAPTDYEPWLWLARAHGALGLSEQAQVCLSRAQELAPPGKALEISPGQP